MEAFFMQNVCIHQCFSHDFRVSRGVAGLILIRVVRKLYPMVLKGKKQLSLLNFYKFNLLIEVAHDQYPPV
jgi:hypothetical protein